MPDPFDATWVSDRLARLRAGDPSARDELLTFAARQLNGRASHLGWLLPQDLLVKKQNWQITLSLLQPAGRPFIGVELTHVPSGPLPALPALPFRSVSVPPVPSE